MVKILFSSAGRRVELINCFRFAANEIGLELEIVAVDMNPDWSPACQVADKSYCVPRCTNEAFIDVVFGICKKDHIDLLIPTIDTELNIYAENTALFSQAGTEILISDSETIAIARNKEMTASVLNEWGIGTPKTWRVSEVLNEKNVFPLLLKPVSGSCSNGIFVADTAEDIKKANIKNSDYVAQELCQGREYTINAFYDRHGTFRTCVPHYRKYVRAGEVCFAETVRIPEFKTIAQKFTEIFKGLRGNICFQGFVNENDKRTVVFEINARFGGGYPICDKAGGTYAKWILQELIGEKPDYHDNWEEGLRMLRYDAAVFYGA